jgi:hypothetical protein
MTHWGVGIMEYWIVGPKTGIFLNKHHRNTHGADKIDNVSLSHHLHYSITPLFRLQDSQAEPEEETG